MHEPTSDLDHSLPGVGVHGARRSIGLSGHSLPGPDVLAESGNLIPGPNADDEKDLRPTTVKHDGGTAFVSAVADETAIEVGFNRTVLSPSFKSYELKIKPVLKQCRRDEPDEKDGYETESDDENEREAREINGDPKPKKKFRKIVRKSSFDISRKLFYRRWQATG